MKSKKNKFLQKNSSKLILFTFLIVFVVSLTVVINTTKLKTNSRAEVVELQKITNKNYIYGGGKATIGEFPYMVGLVDGHKNASGTNIDKLFCGGVVLNEYWIATASHCKNMYQNMYEGDKNNDRDFVKDTQILVLGDNSIDINNPAQTTTIDKIYEWCFGMDQILVKVKDKMTISKYVALADKSMYNIGDPFDIIGFGVTSQNGSKSNELLEAVSKITEPGTFYFQGKGSNGESVCKGDSGSPALKRIGSTDYFIGIATNTLFCGNTTNYFSKVSQIKSCIERQIKQ